METMNRITSNSDRMNGQPCIRNMRLTVQRVLQLVAAYPNREELYAEYPDLEPEDIRQALLYAAATVDDKAIELSTTYETAA